MDVKPGNLVKSNEQSRLLLESGRLFSPGGVNTARRKIDPPMCIRRAIGAYFEDMDGNQYVDYHAAYGPVLLGHSDPVANAAVAEKAESQVLFGVGTTEVEVDLAEKIVGHIPSAEQVAFTTSGTESTFHAIRLARAVTGREKIIKFQGHYHGYHDYVLRNVGSSAEMIGKRDPMSAGMLDAAIDATIVCRHNDLESVHRALPTTKTILPRSSSSP